MRLSCEVKKQTTPTTADVHKRKEEERRHSNVEVNFPNQKGNR